MAAFQWIVGLQSVCGNWVQNCMDFVHLCVCVYVCVCVCAWPCVCLTSTGASLLVSSF